MIVKPFRGLRPRSDLADKIPSYPYDVVDSAEARRIAEGDPYSFLHVIKPEIDLEPGMPRHAQPQAEPIPRPLAARILLPLAIACPGRADDGSGH